MPQEGPKLSRCCVFWVSIIELTFQEIEERRKKKREMISTEPHEPVTLLPPERGPSISPSSVQKKVAVQAPRAPSATSSSAPRVVQNATKIRKVDQGKKGDKPKKKGAARRLRQRNNRRKKRKAIAAGIIPPGGRIHSTANKTTSGNRPTSVMIW